MDETPYDVLGEAKIRALAAAFYERMDTDEPALAHLHALDADGKVSRALRERFALFLIGWLGGPQLYVERHGHPRLRMRHADVPVDTAMRDAWLRAMGSAMGDVGLEGPIRVFLEDRFATVADFLRNVPESLSME
jgi:hemoglobin